MTKYVAKHPTSRKIYHIDADCKRLKKEPNEKSDRFIEWHDLELCSWCDPNKTSHLE